MTLQEQYKQITEKYVQAFLIKHGFHENGELFEWQWIDFIGGIVDINDYYINLDDIRIDIDREIPKDVFLTWYDYSMNAGIVEEPYPNYDNYTRGARWENFSKTEQ